VGGRTECLSGASRGVEAFKKNQQAREGQPSGQLKAGRTKGGPSRRQILAGGLRRLVHQTGQVKGLGEGLTDEHSLGSVGQAEPWRALEDAALLTGDAVSGIDSIIGAKRLLDLDGGLGVVSFSLLRKRDELTAVVVGAKCVCQAGRAIA